MIKLSKTTSSQKLFDYDCVTLYGQSMYSLSMFLIHASSLNLLEKQKMSSSIEKRGGGGGPRLQFVSKISISTKKFNKIKHILSFCYMYMYKIANMLGIF